jgi:hypothetical protein
LRSSRLRPWKCTAPMGTPGRRGAARAAVLWQRWRSTCRPDQIARKGSDDEARRRRRRRCRQLHTEHKDEISSSIALSATAHPAPDRLRESRSVEFYCYPRVAALSAEAHPTRGGIGGETAVQRQNRRLLPAVSFPAHAAIAASHEKRPMSEGAADGLSE